MGTLITDGFDAGDDEKGIEILSKFKGGPISDKLFTVLAGIIPTTPLVVVFIKNKEDPEVLFIQRPKDDPFFPSTLNLPGKMIRASDFHRSDNTPENGAFERIQKSEIHTSFSKKPKFAGVNVNTDARGPWVALVYVVEIDSDDEYKGVGEWIKVSKIEKRSDLIQSEMTHIKVAFNYLASSNHLPSL